MRRDLHAQRLSPFHEPIEHGLESFYRALRPGGRIAVADFPPKRLLSLIAPVRNVSANRHGHGVPPDVVRREMTAAGFDFIERVPDWPEGRYCLVFRKPQ